MTAEQARFLGGAVRKYGEKGCLDITTRANMQLRGIPLEDAGDIMNGLQSVGLTSVQTGKHVVLGSRMLFVWMSSAHDHLGSIAPSCAGSGNCVILCTAMPAVTIIVSATNE